MTTINRFKTSNLVCKNLLKTKQKISTGIGYADHMIDQLNSHAQLGIAVTVTDNNANNSLSDPNRHASSLDDQIEIMKLLGKVIGTNMRPYLPIEGSSRFCCPLDEALVECHIRRSATIEDGKHIGSLDSFTLPPYGICPYPNGRTKIGRQP